MSEANRWRALNALAGLVFIILCCSQAGNASPRSLEELLREVSQERVVEQAEHKKREQRFLEARDQRQAILAEAKRTLAEEHARADRLKQRFDANDALIQEKTRVLQQANQEGIGELPGIVRRSASDLAAIAESSLVSAEFPEGTGFLRRLSQSEELPSIEDLETLWQTLLQHMVESGKVSRFKAKIIARDGAEEEHMITRVGTFDAIADGEFLRYQPTTKRLLVPARQPPSRLKSLARAFEESDQELCELPVDPTRGMSLELLLQKPGVFESAQQGGVIAYVIMALGFAALLVAVNRYPAASALGRKVRRQRREPKPDDTDPLGRITKADADDSHLDLDEVVLREPPAVRRRLSIAAIVGLAALLNLLLFYFIYRLAAPQDLKSPRDETLRPVTFIRMPKPQEARTSLGDENNRHRSRDRSGHRHSQRWPLRVPKSRRCKDRRSPHLEWGYYPPGSRVAPTWVISSPRLWRTLSAFRDR